MAKQLIVGLITGPVIFAGPRVPIDYLPMATHHPSVGHMLVGSITIGRSFKSDSYSGAANPPSAAVSQLTNRSTKSQQLQTSHVRKHVKRLSMKFAFDQKIRVRGWLPSKVGKNTHFSGKVANSVIFWENRGGVP